MAYITAVVAVGFLVSFLYLLWRQPNPFKPKDWLQYAFLARYQLLVLCLLVGFGWAAKTILPDMLGNLLILNTWAEVAVVTWFAILTAWVCFFTLRVLAHSATLRFDQLPALRLPDGPWSRRMTRSSFYVLAALPLLVAIFQESQDLSLWVRGLGIAIGWLAALLCGLFQQFLFRHATFVQRWFQQITIRLPKSLLNGLFRGYLFETGHGSAFLFFLVIVVVYIGGLLLFSPMAQAMRFEPPALAYLLLLLILLGWLLPGLAFFLDRYRLPVAVAILLVSYIVWRFGETDYFYPLQPKAQQPTVVDAADLTPTKALQAWHEQHKDDQLPLVIITTSGGGIKAAVWTTSMLQALQSWLGPAFAEHIVLISSVSGGSVGVLHYLDAYQPGGPPTAAGLAEAVKDASTPSLASAAWGLVYPDLWQYGFGNRVRNRGWAMEQAWKRSMTHRDATLANWRADIRAGVRPAVLFNATIIENGALFVFTPLDERNPEEDPEVDQWHSVYFNTVYPTYTVAASTAARMSATFPYASPIARPMIHNQPVAPKGYHLADGGYFDNYGIVSALEWLDAVAPEIRQQQRRVVLVRLEASLFEQQYLSDANDQAGWIYSVAGPLLGAVKSLFTAQKWRNDQVIELLAQKPGVRSAALNEGAIANPLGRSLQNIEIEPFFFVYRDAASLSWQLAKAETNRIHCAANADIIRKVVGQLCTTFYSDTPDAERCQAIPSLVELAVLTAEQCKVE